METVLVRQWLDGAEAIEVIDEASLTLARDAIRALAVSTEVIDRALLVVSELGRNQLRHARSGQISSRVVERDGNVGVEIVAVDAGEGIRDIERALDAPLRTVGSLGVGMGAVRRLSTDLDIDVRRGEGSCVRARVFVPGVERRHEVGICGRAIAGELKNGDHAAFLRTADTLAVTICDGLGHGPSARTAADAAIEAFQLRATGGRPEVILGEAHLALGRTRGAVMVAATVGRRGDVELASVGNIETAVTGFRHTRRFGGIAATVGGRPGTLRPRAETGRVAVDEVLLLMTDGIVSRASIEDDGALLRAHPAVIAERVLNLFARPNDDALVVVVR